MQVNLKDQNDQKNPSFVLSIRFLTGVILFFGYCFQYMVKISISIGIVCMVNNTAISSSSSSSLLTSVSINNSKTVDPHCPAASTSKEHHSDGPFIWDKSIQGLILSSYFYGYFLTQILGGFLSFKFGPRRVLAFTMLLASVSTLVIPPSARASYIILFICRFVTGLAHGAFWPAISSLWSQWAPAQERSMLCGIASSGSWIGNIIALPFGSFLCVSGFDSGWPSIFYIFGVLSLIWSVGFFFIVTDTPAQNRFISQREKDYIIRETKKSAVDPSGSTPWKELLTCRASIAIFVSHFCSNFGLYLFLTSLPTYLKDVLKYDIKSNGAISALPYIGCSIANIASSIISDKIVQSGLITRTNSRKLMGAIGSFVPMLAVLWLAFVTCESPILAVGLIVIGNAFSAVTWGGGHLININDISGPYSGILFGISNTIATVPGFVVPALVGWITKNQSQKEWQIILFMCAGINFIGGIVYIAMADGNLQPWAISQDKSKQECKPRTETRF